MVTPEKLIFLGLLRESMVLLESNDNLIKKWKLNKKKIIKNETYDIIFNKNLDTDDNLERIYKESQKDDAAAEAATTAAVRTVSMNEKKR